MLIHNGDFGWYNESSLDAIEMHLQDKVFFQTSVGFVIETLYWGKVKDEELMGKLGTLSHRTHNFLFLLLTR